MTSIMKIIGFRFRVRLTEINDALITISDAFPPEESSFSFVLKQETIILKMYVTFLAQLSYDNQK